MSDNTDYCLSVIGGLSGTVGFGGTQLQLIVDDALESYGVETEAEMEDVAKKKALLRYYTWVRIRNEFVLDFDYRADGESFNRSQVVKQLNDLVQEAYVKAAPYLSEAESSQDYIDLGFSPYRRSS
jgi:hypothetical protein